jgi:hypothetical protein
VWVVWSMPFVRLGGDLGNEYFDQLAGELYAAVISDVLGYRDQALDARIVNSAGPEMLIGRAARRWPRPGHDAASWD